MWKIYSGACLLILFLLLYSAGGMCGEFSRIELDDGSVIAGELISVNDGIYTIKTASLGTVKVKSSDVVSINNQPAVKKKSQAGSQVPAGELNALQQQLIGNEEIMRMILSLQNDPSVQKALSDPEFMRAVNSWDINALLANPLFMDILANPTVQQIKEKSNK